MTIESASAIASFGVTERQARFLVTVMLHSGDKRLDEISTEDVQRLKAAL